MPYSDSYDANEGVAIVGMSGRFPGASTPAALWHALTEGKDAITRFAPDEIEPGSPEELEVQTRAEYVRARGILNGVDEFDNAFFSINPREAEVMDPQQRLFLQAAWEGLEDAGHDPQTFAGLIGVFAGSSNNSYYHRNVLSRPDMIAAAGEYATMMGNEKDFLATRVAYKLDLRGPALSIQNACATSLVATCVAVQSLLNYQCDMALAGGVSIMLPQRRGYLWQEGSIMSPDGRCRAFGAKAAGTVPGNGIGIVVLRRLSDALADGDRIYAVIKGAALNNDGSTKVSFMAPNADGQAQVIAMAQAQAGIDPDTVSYVEAHGTATLIGDPIEVSGLTQAFRTGGATRNGYCALGSIKSNIGHLDAAAGVAGLIKAALSLHHKQLPPTLHFETPNPQLSLEQTPFYVNDRLREWPAGRTPRRAGVSSFGVGGTNAHLVLEEAPAQSSSPSRARQLLVLSARSAEGVERSVRRLCEHLQSHPNLNLADVAYTLQVGRRGFEHRRAFVCSDNQRAINALGGADPKAVIARAARGTAPSVAFLFPGQGAQYVNMGRTLFQGEPRFRQEIDAGAEVLKPLLGLDLRSILYPDDEQAYAAARAKIMETSITQPAMFLVEYALAQLWMSWGVRPGAMIGHSLGEYVAATLAGVFTRDDALRLVARRARLMQEMPVGSMLAVRASAEAIAPFLKGGVSIAAMNAPKLTVVAGEKDAIAAVQAELAAQNIASRPLATSHAFHSAMMQPAAAQFEAVIAATPRSSPRQLWISSLTGELITAEQATDPSYWASQLRQPVQFAKGIGCLSASHPLLLEVGPGQTLVSFAKQVAEYKADQVMTSLHPAQDYTADLDYMLRALGQMWVAGVLVDWSAYYEHETRCRVSLPTYSFDPHRRWIEPGQQMSDRQPSETARAPASQNVTIEEVMPESNVAAPQEEFDDLLLSQLQSLFAELSGLEPDSLKEDVGFLELGLDSLFLTQASVALEKKFGVKIGFRELLDEYSTLQLLAKHLRPHVAVIPAVKPTPQPKADVVTRHGAVDAAVASVSFDAAGTPSLQDVLKMQLQLMARQLEMLSGATPPTTVSVAPLPNAVSAVQAQAARPAGRTEDATSSPPPVTAMGPYRPLVKGNTGPMSAEQQARLKDLIAKYNGRTRGSKQYTETHRPHLADPRSVAGFRQIWKEAVYPIVVNRSSGSKVWDIDGHEYVDLTNGFGINLFGHNPAFINEAIQAQLATGLEIGPQTPLAGEVARLITEMVGMDRVVFCNTGSEAVTAALRIARTVTKRDKIAVFAGSYHGIFDEVLVRPAGGGVGVRALPVAPGLAGNVGQNVVILEYDNPESLRYVRTHGAELAAVLVEPIQSRRPELQPRDFLRQLREVTSETGSALIFDEMVTGFRSHSGGVQALFAVRADIATYGKVVGGGLPLGVVAGSSKFMDALDGGAWRYGDESSPEVGMTIFAGTFVRHPLALAAARATLIRLKQEGPELQRQLNLRTSAFVKAMNEFARSVQAPLQVVHFASWFCFNWQGAVPMASLFFVYMRLKGVHLWEGRPAFLTVAHSEADLEFVLDAFKATIREMQSAGFLPGAAASEPPLSNARRGRDASGREAWFVPDPDRPGKYLQVAEVGS